MSLTSRWHGRALAAEAAACLIVARALIRGVRFARWRGWLGAMCRAPATVTGRCDVPRPAWLAVGAVERADRRLGGSKCLPRAMALHWMLARRRIPAVLRIGASIGLERGRIDDLHAWVTLGPAILIGRSDERYGELIAFSYSSATFTNGGA